MINWQVTATTILCDAVDDEVTIMVYQDGSVICTGYQKYGEPGKDTANLLRAKSKRQARKLACEGLGCSRIIDYKNKLLTEETNSCQQ